MPVAYTHDHGSRTLSFYPYTQSQGKENNSFGICISYSCICFGGRVNDARGLHA